MVSLLDVVELGKHLITDDCDIESVEYEVSIDIKVVNQTVEAARNKSIDFLKRAIC